MHGTAVQTTDNLLTEDEAASFLNLSVRTLQAWRVKGGGPLFVRLGRAVRYRSPDICRWLDANTLARTSQHTAPVSAPLPSRRAANA